MALRFKLDMTGDQSPASVDDILSAVSSATHIARAIEMMATDIGDRDKMNAFATLAYALASGLEDITEALEALDNPNAKGAAQ